MELLLLEENSEISFKIQNNKIFFNTNTMATQWSTKSNPFSLYLPILYHPFSFPLLRFLPNSSSSAAAAKLLQPCPTLCDLRDGSPPGSCVPGILQARTLEWVAISFSNAWKWKVEVKSLSRVRLLVTPWTAAHQAPPNSSTYLHCNSCTVCPSQKSQSNFFRVLILKSKSKYDHPLLNII